MKTKANQLFQQNVMNATSTFSIMHLICPRKFCITFVFISPGYYSRPIEIENSAYANFWGQIRCIMGNVKVAYSTKRDFLLFISHLHISHNTSCLPPPPPNFSITLALYFPWVLQSSQEKLKTA